LIQVVLSGAIGVALALLPFMLWRHMGSNSPARIDLRTFDTVAILSHGLSVILSSLIAGFVAARIAEYRPVLHGALSGSVSLLLALRAALLAPSFGMQSRAHFATSSSLALAFAALLFGALGAYIAAQRAGGASRHDVTPVSPGRFIESGLIAKFVLAPVATALICAFIFFSPTIFCHGGGAGGNCGEAYMVSIPAAMLLSPFILAGMVFLI
jgi:hypothetical protein